MAHAVPARAGQRRIWTTRRALVAHVVLAVWVPGCAVACWWQLGIALGGDDLGWVYSVMWPCFAVFALVFWWHFIHDDPDTLGRAGLARARAREAAGAVGDDRAARAAAQRLEQAEAEDPELAAYNAYLSALSRARRASARRER